MSASTVPRDLGPRAVSRPRWAEMLDRPLTSYYLVLGTTAMLVALGLVMVLSASSVMSIKNSQSPLTIFNRQLMWCAIGVPLLWAMSRTPVRVLRWLAYPLLVGTLGLLALVHVPGFGVEVNGNRNWVEFGGPFRLQPSELAKLALVVWGADLLARKTRLLERWRHLLVPLVPIAVLVIGLVLLGRDLGTALVLMAITAGLLFFAGAPMRLFAVLSALAAGVVMFLAVSSDNRRARLLSFLNPSANPESTGYQLLHSKYALGSGGWFGLGLGASREKWGGLPEQQTDFIFAVIGEELGLVGTLGVLALFTALVYAGMRIALHTEDAFVRFTAAGLTVWIAVQAMVNIGAVIGVLPIAGIPLPLVSYGGSALLPTMLALGILLAFARQEPSAASALAARGPGRIGRTVGTWRPRRSAAPRPVTTGPVTTGPATTGPATTGPTTPARSRRRVGRSAGWRGDAGDRR